MAKPTGFGISGTSDLKYRQSKTTNRTSSVADLIDEEGKIVQQCTHGVAEEITEEFFCDSPETAQNLVTALQSGGEVVTGMTINEKNNDFCRATITKRVLPDYVAESAGE